MEGAMGPRKMRLLLALLLHLAQGFIAGHAKAPCGALRNQQQGVKGTAPKSSSPDEGAALLQFKETANSSLGCLQTWNSSAEPNHCAWDGVLCDAQGYVTSLLAYLDLHGNSLSSTFPSLVAQMASLARVKISGNSFSGPLPAGFFRPTLQALVAYTNSFRGPLPTSIGLAADLRNLNLASNSLTGTLPDALGSLKSLVQLDLAGNRLTGPIPASLGACTALTALFLQRNSLSGSLPDSLWGITQLRHVALGYNQLSGSIPSALSALRDLTALDLRSNALQGGLPALFAGLSSLHLLWLSHNPALGGSLPPWGTQLANLSDLRMGNCSLVGPIPGGFFSIDSLSQVDLTFNFLNSTLPSEALAFTNGSVAPFQQNCLQYSEARPAKCPFRTQNGLCLLPLQRDLAECLPPVPPSPSGVDGALGAAVLVLVAGVVLAVLGVGIAAALLRGRTFTGCAWSTHEDWDKLYMEGSDGAAFGTDTELPLMAPELERFTMDQVWAATANFSNYLDPDDLRPAFHGKLAYKEHVIVRLLPLPEEQLADSKAEFAHRLWAMSRFSNAHVLGCRGYAYEDGCFVAVFEPAKETLFQRLHTQHSGKVVPPLTWRERMRIMLGVADALQYLHGLVLSAPGAEGGVAHVVHGDVKSSNVLLTSDMRAKLFDTLVPRNAEDDPLRAVAPQGSFGYLDPNYADTRALTRGSDVYSFGVLLLEAITGRPALQEDSATLIVLVQDYFILRGDYPKLLDSALPLRGPAPGSLGEAVPWQELVDMVELVQACTQMSEASRPTMAWVCEHMMASLRMGPDEYRGAAKGGGMEASASGVALAADRS